MSKLGLSAEAARMEKYLPYFLISLYVTFLILAYGSEVNYHKILCEFLGDVFSWMNPSH